MVGMRYIVDKRIGCCAVVDTQHPDYDPEYPGLGSEGNGVVKFWLGNMVVIPGEGNTWALPEWCVTEAEALADALNKDGNNE